MGSLVKARLFPGSCIDRANGVILFEQQCADETGDGAFLIGEEADDICAISPFAFQRIVE